LVPARVSFFFKLPTGSFDRIMTRRRVAITGMGTVNPLGNNLHDYWRSLRDGRSGIGPIDLFDPAPFKVRFGGQVRNLALEPAINSRLAKRLDRFTQFALVAAVEALRDSELKLAAVEGTSEMTKENHLHLEGIDPFRISVIIGSGIGGMTEYEEQHTKLLKSGPTRISPFLIPKMMVNAAPGQISIYFGTRGTNFAISTACASAANAIGEALRKIQWGEADLAITGGSEATITPLAVAGFIQAQALSERNDAPQKASRPFDKDRDGFVLAEGAGVLVLEEMEQAKKRGARIYAELLGYGATADAYNITAPCPDGSGAGRAMQLALKDAGLNTTDVQYVNAHGTSTPLGDVAETMAVKTVFGDHARKLAINSTKSMTGHTLGASGGLELIATVLQIHHGVLHPTINLETPDPQCDLDYVPNQAREQRVRFGISNSFGFGGHNASLAVGPAPGR
jgi:3-oxoacyl-[acyl-carrier-protein] synthase II